MNLFKRFDARLHELPIHRKLAVIGLSTAGVALFILALLLSIAELSSKQTAARNTLAIQADLLSGNVSHAMVFDDERTAREVLGQLRFDTSIEYAAIHNREELPFAEFVHTRATEALNPANFPTPGKYRFAGARLFFNRPILFDGEVIGHLHLVKDMSAAYGEAARQIGLLFLASLLALAGASLFFRRFQAAVSEPIVALTEVMDEVRRSENHSLRATVPGHDELGRLAEGFNAMLAAIENSESQLARHNIVLEEMVMTRTEELERANADLRAQVAERERAERQLHELNENLAERIEAEVAKNREMDHLLIQQSRLAAMGEMVHNIAHQWRQPLNALGLILQNVGFDFEDGTLTHQGMTEQTSKAMKLIHGMSTTIDEFRNFFRPDRQPEDFDLGRAVEEALDVTEASLVNHDIHLRKDLQGSLLVHGYSHQFAQAVLNLVSNAKDAILTRKVSAGCICLTLEKVADQGVLTIRDNGGGIAEDDLEHIFEPYFTTKKQGSGIGLYMSKTIVERNMKGNLEAGNFEGGARFTIRLPLTASAPEQAQ